MKLWEGEFGDEYTERNKNLASRCDFWTMLNEYQIFNALEVGCNCGRNLLDIETVTDIECVGLDMNEKALTEAMSRGLEVEYGVGEALDFPSNEFDLVFTVGVLIHMRTPELVKTMLEMTRVSKKYVFFAEYLGDDEEVPYRGERQALFKRRYSDIYEALIPDAVLVSHGELHKDDGFDDVNYWMYDISNSTSKDAIKADARKGYVENKRSSDVGPPSEPAWAVSGDRRHSGGYRTGD